MATKGKRKASAGKGKCQKRAPAKRKATKRRDEGLFSDDGHPYMEW